MFEVPQFLTQGYGILWAACAASLLYYLLIVVFLLFPRKAPVAIIRYEPPEGISPAQAAWIRERGGLPRALAAAIVSLVAKESLSIEKWGDIYRLKKLADGTKNLSPEESSLMYSWFQSDIEIELPAPSRQLYRAVQDFNNAIESVLDPVYFSKYMWLYLPAWGIAGLCTLMALIQGDFFSADNGGVYYAVGAGLFYGFGWFVVAEKSVWRTLRKLATYLPGRNVPRQPLIVLDFAPLALVLMAASGIILLAGLSSLDAAFVIAAFLIVNSLFFRTFRGPTAEGRELMWQLEGYRKFVEEVEADPITRLHWPEEIPLHLSGKAAYALALGLDLGWGEEFLAAIADTIEFAGVFGSGSNVQDNPKSDVLELLSK